MRVLSAMSGGVDSSVATARLLAAGHEVTGIHLALSRTPLAQRAGSRLCCLHEARVLGPGEDPVLRVAAWFSLHIPR